MHKWPSPAHRVAVEHLRTVPGLCNRMQSLMGLEKDSLSEDVTTTDIEGVLRAMWLFNQTYMIATEVVDAFSSFLLNEECG